MKDWDKQEIKEEGFELGIKQERERILKLAEKISTDAEMYASMDEPAFWETSVISQEDARRRANYYWNFLNELKDICAVEDAQNE